MRLIAAVLVGLIVALVQAQPPAGLYLSLRQDFIASVASDVALRTADYVNSDTSIPAISGSNSQVSYTISNFIFDIDIDQFSLTTGVPPALTVAYNEFQFVTQCNFHICAQSWPHPCDDGYVQIYTTAPAGMSVGMTFDFSGPSVALAADSVDLINPQNVYIYVQCTDTFCLIPVSDIVNAIAQNFVPTFQSTVLKGINTALSKYSGIWPTTVTLPSLHVAMKLNGGFDVLGSSLALYADGLVVPSSGPSINPPFSPSFVPPASDLSDPPGPITSFVTSYLVETAIWAASVEGIFNHTITQADIPSSVPIQLNTSNIFFAFAVPGVRSYPGLAIQFTTGLEGLASVNFTESGGNMTIPIALSFSLVNGSTLIPGWSLLLSVTIPFSANASMSGDQIEVTPSTGNLTGVVTLISSELGTVSIPYFQTAVSAALKKVPVTLPSFALPPLKDFSFSGPGFDFEDGYAGLMFDLTYSGSIPDIPCGEVVCAAGNTCCSWSDGSGCCTLPDASCCARAGCCPAGTTCQGEQCYSNVDGALWEIQPRTYRKGTHESQLSEAFWR